MNTFDSMMWHAVIWFVVPWSVLNWSLDHEAEAELFFVPTWWPWGSIGLDTTDTLKVGSWNVPEQWKESALSPHACYPPHRHCKRFHSLQSPVRDQFHFKSLESLLTTFLLYCVCSLEKLPLRACHRTELVYTRHEAVLTAAHMGRL